MKKLSAKEILEIIDKQWAGTNDVKDIGSVGQGRALKIMKEIREETKNEGYFLPQHLVPMERVIAYFKINVSYLKKVSTKEDFK